ncbi:MAG: response regulator [Planctomycetota bacterium]
MNGSSLIQFTRSCPTCGRRIRIRGTMLGKTVACGHCNAEFIATTCDDSAVTLDVADQLLSQAVTDQSPSAKLSMRLDLPSSNTTP